MTHTKPKLSQTPRQNKETHTIELKKSTHTHTNKSTIRTKANTKTHTTHTRTQVVTQRDIQRETYAITETKAKASIKTKQTQKHNKCTQ